MDLIKPECHNKPEDCYNCIRYEECEESPSGQLTIIPWLGGIVLVVVALWVGAIWLIVRLMS